MGNWWCCGDDLSSDLLLRWGMCLTRLKKLSLSQLLSSLRSPGMQGVKRRVSFALLMLAANPGEYTKDWEAV